MMKHISEENSSTPAPIESLVDLAELANYSLVDNLNCDPDANESGDEVGVDHAPRQVFSGHYVPVKPTLIESPEYIAHSKQFFQELGFADSLAESDDFIRMFSGDLSQVPAPLRKVGWATGYALSIYGTEYIQQCPFQTGNGYGDGRAMSVLEGVFRGQRWEMQLKGGGRTPYCRGADGRAVLRSSVREFLAQEHMQSLGVPTSRSLSLYVSKTEHVQRPWYSPGSRMKDPDVYVSEAVAISTRVAPSFLRVGQLELFGRRVRNKEHPKAMEELEKIVLHLIDREYSDVIDNKLTTAEKVVLLANEFCNRLTSLIANWIRVGFCQGNFNSDNCAAGGFTLDYGPYGFCDVFDPYFQSWTGGGQHFAFLNQPAAAQKNYKMFCTAVRHLLNSDLASDSDSAPDSPSSQDYLSQLDKIESDFPKVMQAEMEKMWAAKLGLDTFDSDLFSELETLMEQTPVDYTIFFRELSTVPDNIESLKKSFYRHSKEIEERWSEWLTKWKALIDTTNLNSARSQEELSSQMKLVNPKYSLREWFVASAYQQAAKGNYSLIRELQEVMTQPYEEQSKEVEEKFYRLKPVEFFGVGGLSYYSCSS